MIDLHAFAYVHAQRSPYHTCTRYSCCSLFGSKWSKYHQAWKASLMFVNGEVSGENPLKVRERALLRLVNDKKKPAKPSILFETTT